MCFKFGFSIRADKTEVLHHLWIDNYNAHGWVPGPEIRVHPYTTCLIPALIKKKKLIERYFSLVHANSILKLSLRHHVFRLHRYGK